MYLLVQHYLERLSGAMKEVQLPDGTGRPPLHLYPSIPLTPCARHHTTTQRAPVIYWRFESV